MTARAQILFLVVLGLHQTSGGEDMTIDAPGMQVVFQDDFAKDTRSDYTLEGEVAWEPGKLTLPEQSMLTRTINAGSSVVVDLQVHPNRVNAQQERWELRLWFVMLETTSFYVELQQTWETEGMNASIELVDAVPKDGNMTKQFARKMAVGDRELRDVRVTYKQGLVRVSVADKEVFIGFINNGSAPIRDIALRSEALASRFESLAVTKQKTQPREFTEQEKVQLSIAETENEKLGELFQQGKYGEALKVGERVLSIREAVLGEQHSDYFRSLINLGNLYHYTGNHARAESLLEKAVDIAKLQQGEQHPAYATCLSNLAAHYQVMQDNAQAEPLYEQALKIRKLVLGTQHPEYAESLNGLAVMYESMGEYARAIPLYEEALEIQKTALGEQHLHYAGTLNNLAVVHMRLGNFTQAERLYVQASAIQKSVAGEEHPNYATSLENLAYLYNSMGDYARAVTFVKQALQIRMSALGDRHPKYAKSLNNLAAMYSNMGDYARAEPLLQEASDIWKSVYGEQHPEFASSLNNLAGLYQIKGDYARAAPLYKRALEIRKSLMGEQHPYYASSLDNLAQLYRDMGDYAHAERLYGQALGIWKSALGERHPEYASTVNGLAMMHQSMGELARAASLCEKALAIRKEALGEQHPDYAANLNAIARLYESMGQMTRAEPLFSQAARIQRDWLSHNAAVQSSRQQHRNQTQKRVYLDTRLTHAVTTGNEPDSAASDLWQWKGAVTFRQQAYRKVAGNPELAPVFVKLRSITRQLSVLTSRAPIPPPKSASDIAQREFERKKKAWEVRVAVLTHGREELEHDIAARSEEFRNVVEPLTVASVQAVLPKNTALIDFLQYNHSTPDPEQKGKWVDEQRYLAVVVRETGAARLVSINSAAEIGKTITTFRSGFTEEAAAAPSQQAAVKLRERLWDPIEKHLAGIDAVIISPDTILGTLPFAALPGRSPNSYLIEDYQIVSIPFVNLLPSLRDEAIDHSENSGLLVVGDIDYDAPATPSKPREATELLALSREQGPLSRQRSGVTFESLKGFAAEQKAVESLRRKQFGENAAVDTLSGSDATERALLDRASRYDTLHVITHAFFSAPNVRSLTQSETDLTDSVSRKESANVIFHRWLPGLLSGLAMAGANKPPNDSAELDDGILRASEIESVSLKGVGLVVLSACETGLGAEAGGEGLTGLQRAFHVAGARSVVASLWKVDDTATLELMKRFYTNLWVKKMSKLDALRDAQLWVLNNPSLLNEEEGNRGALRVKRKLKSGATMPKKTSPYYWAPFVLSGDWR